MQPWLTVIGIGEDGVAGLGRPARRALREASLVVGGARHLAMLPKRYAAGRVQWPQPFSLEPVLARRGDPTCVLASGDPMHFGVGAALARVLPSDEYRVLPAPSSFSLAAACLGWPLADVATVSLLGRPLDSLRPHLRDGARLLVLTADGQGPAALAAWLCDNGQGASRFTVLGHLGGDAQSRTEVACARDWGTRIGPALNLVAVVCEADVPDLAPSPGAARALLHAGASATRAHDDLPVAPGLPDDAFTHDGQLTKRDVRALALARLAPRDSELLWDVGAGCGSIGIEWVRASPQCRAIAVEASPLRQEFIARNRIALNAGGLSLVAGTAPAALAGLPTPDAVFIGGGITDPDVLERCWQALRPAGRLVANAVTLQSEARLLDWHARHGGTLLRIALAEARPLGAFETWRPALPITLLHVSKPA